MQLTIELDDKLAQEFFSLVPEEKRNLYFNILLGNQLNLMKKLNLLSSSDEVFQWMLIKQVIFLQI